MAIAIDADVADPDRVRPHVANQSRPHQKSVAIEFAAAAIVVVERARLNRVTLLEEILPKNIRDVNILLPPIETIQAAVRVFLQLRKISRIELITVVAERSKQSRAQVVVGKNKATKIRHERLNPNPRRNKIKILVHVRQLHFRERFFQRKLRVRAIGAAPHVDIHDAGLAGV